MPETNYIWDPVNDSYLMETDAAGATTAVYTNEPGQYGPLISQRRASTTNYYHYDGLGSTRELTNSVEGVTDTYLNSAFGEQIAKTGTTVNPFRFVGALGYYYDDDLASNYVRARAYLPNPARWASVDPLRPIHNFDIQRCATMWRTCARDLSGATSAYTMAHPFNYAKNNPVSTADPSGLIPPLVAAVGVVAAAAACVGPYFAWMKWGTGVVWNNNNWAHCVVSCRATKTCGNVLTLVGGLVKELADALGMGVADVSDILSNVDGIWCAGWESQLFGPFGAVFGVWFRDSCDECCRQQPGVGGPIK